jgi:phospholipase/carboxylesterase
MNPLALHRHLWNPAATGTGPVFLLLHGTGGDENDLLPLAHMIAPGAATLSVRGNVLERGAPRFFRRLAEGVFDLDDLRVRTGELARFIAAAAAEYGFATERLYALGLSNGANIAASLLFSQPDALAGGILLRAMVPFEPNPLPALAGKSVLMSQGKQDPLISTEVSERLASLLRAGGARVDLVWQPGGHQLGRGDVVMAQEWLQKENIG